MKVSSAFDKQIKKQGVTFSGILEAYLTNRIKFNPYEMQIDRNKLIGFHPSMLHNACARQLAFLFLKEKKAYHQYILEDELNINVVKNNSHLEFIFDVGHALHGLIQYSYLPDIPNLDYHVEQPLDSLYDRFLIGGTYDVDVVLQDHNIWLGDIKTMLQSKFGRLDDVSKIDSNYIVQLNLYMLGARIPRAFFVFVNKNTTKPQFKDFFLKFDKRIVIEPLEKAVRAKQFLLGKRDVSILPECYKKEGKFKYCSFSSLCFRCKTTETLSDFIKEKRSDLIEKQFSA
jgi:hypothetical protein